MHLIRLLPLAAAVMLVAFATACSTSGCLENQSAVPRAEFCSSATGETVSIDSMLVYGVGVPGDSLLKSDSRAAATVYLPLRSSSAATSFCFRYTEARLNSPALADTLTLAYTSEPRFVSEECGAMYFYRISSLTCTTHLIDSVALRDPLVDNVDRTTLAIYFRIAREEPDTIP